MDKDQSKEKGAKILDKKKIEVQGEREEINNLRISNEDIRMDPRKKIMRPEGA
jgi:hypothetical protein